MPNSTSTNTRELFFKKHKKHYLLFLEPLTPSGAFQFSQHILCTLHHSDLY